MADRSFSPVENRILVAMVEVLETSAAARDDASRAMWLELLEENLGPLILRENPVRRQFLLGALRACAGLPRGLATMVDITVWLDTAPRTGDALRLLLDEWETTSGLFQGMDWSQLRQSLEFPVEGHHLRALVAAASRERLPLPARCTTAWQTFVHLGCVNRPPEGLPPGVAFLEHLMLLHEAAAAVGEIRAWNDQWADMSGPDAARAVAALRSELTTGRRGRASAAAGDGGVLPEPAVPTIRLMIQLAPDLAPPDSAEAKYRLSSAQRWPPGGWERDSRDEDRLIGRGELAAAVAGMLTRKETAWRGQAARVVLEFLLPTDLLNEPVEWWDRDPTAGYNNPLIDLYPVILLHSLDRLLRPETHRNWRNRWEQLKNRPEDVRFHMSEPTSANVSEHLAVLDRSLGSDELIVGMVMSAAPAPEGSLGRDELKVALTIGLPAIVWHREDCLNGAFRAAVEELLKDGALGRLPERGSQLKLGSAGPASAPRVDGVARHLAILWDDPEQLTGGTGSSNILTGGLV